MKKIVTAFLVFVLSFSFVGCKEQLDKLNDVEYALSLTLNDDMTLDGVMTFNYTNHNNSMQNLKFNLYPNGYSKQSKIEPISYEYSNLAYPNGKSYGSIEILSVTSENNPLNYQITGENYNVLQVEKPFKRGEKIRVDIEFKTTLANVLHRLGYGENTINLCNFYPIISVIEDGNYVECLYYPYGDPFYSENASYGVEITVPSTYSVASSLYCEGVEIADNLTTYKYTQSNVKDVAFILSNNFEILKDKIDNIDVYYYYFSDKKPEKTLKIIKESLAFFNKEYFKYPYKNYVVCQSDFIYGGMEYPCLVYVDEKLTNSDLFYTVVHETAHQWWYGIVGDNEIIDAYIDEGLTEFSTINFFDNHKEYGIDKNQFIKNTSLAYDKILANLIEMGINANHGLRYSLKDYSGDIEYVATAYYKSAVTFFEIEKAMGEKRFNEFLKKFIKKYAYKNVNTCILEKEFKKANKRAYEIFLKAV